MSPSSLSAASATMNSRVRSTASPIAAKAASSRAALAPRRRRDVAVVVCASSDNNNNSAELTGTEKFINGLTSFLNNSPLAQGE